MSVLYACMHGSSRSFGQKMQILPNGNLVVKSSNGAQVWNAGIGRGQTSSPLTRWGATAWANPNGDPSSGGVHCS